MKLRLNKLMALCLSLSMILSLFPTGIMAVVPETLASWEFLADTGETTKATLPVAAADGVNADSKFEHYSTVGTGDSLTLNYTASSKTIYTNGWEDADTTDKYWHITTESTGYEKLNVSFGAYGTDTSPKTFALEYYDADSANWVEVNTYELANRSGNAAAGTYSIDLPAQTANLTELRLRFRAVGTESIIGGTVVSGGNSRMANIVITGVAIADDTQVAMPAASVTSGTAVASGTTVALSTTTAGAKIYYTTDGTAPDTSSTEYTTPITIIADTTIKAIAADPNGVLTSSDMATFTYTIKGADTGATFVRVTDVTDITAGYYLIRGFHNAVIDDGVTNSGFITIANSSGTRLMSTQLTIAGDAVTTGDALCIWELVETGSGFRLQNFETGEYIYYGDNTGNNIYQSTTTPAAGGVWTALYESGVFRLQEVSSTRQLSANRFGNAGSYYIGFAAYANSSSTLRSLEFYKLADDSSLDMNVATPTASRSSGTAVASGSTVTLSTATAGASIYYTTDETEPTAQNGTLYTGAITITADVTIKAIAAKGGRADSEVAVFEYIVKDDPKITAVTPKKGAVLGDDNKPNITADIKNVTEGTTAKLTLTLRGAITPTLEVDMTVTEVDAGAETYKAAYTPTEALTDGKYTAKVVVTRPDNETAEYEWYFTVGESTYNMYFGQLHSHTTYSDGAGSLESALDYIKNLAAGDNVDFVAFTDHSNYFDTTTAANPKEALYDTTKMTAASTTLWDTYKSTIAAFNTQFGATGVLAIGGFEMTWSGGPGHINTFNSPGIVSRNNSTLNAKTNNTGMQAYYDLLVETEGSISQFNHPGTTFGTFANFAYYTVARDEAITMIEVGNGEGSITSTGYFPSYEYYTQALDKGWHLAPTNNQDNHKGQWGNANTTRSVFVSDELTENSIYQAMDDMSMYATEDKNLEIMYTLNGELMGSTIDGTPESVNIYVKVNDPDADDVGGKIQVIVNGGIVAYEEAYTDSSCIMEVTLPASYSYYYIRVVQSDNDIAVTAPVWVGETAKVGVTDVTTDTVMAVAGEEMTFKTSMYNYEETNLTINKITYTETYLGAETILDPTEYGYIASGTVTAGTSEEIFTLNYTPEKTGYVMITAKVEATLNGTAYVFTKSIEFEVLDPNDVIEIAIDAGHSNFYVSGNYANSDSAFIEMCAMNGVRAVRLQAGELTYDNLKDKKMLVLTVPQKSSSATSNDVEDSLYTAAELAAIAEYAANGGSIVVCSNSDRSDRAGGTKASEITNGILEALGTDTRVGEAIVVDPTRKSNELYRITLGGESEEDQKVFNYAGMAANDLVAMMLKDVQGSTNNTFSAYNSAPIIPGTNAEVLVSGFPTTTFSVPYADLSSNTALKDPYTTVTGTGETNLMTIEALNSGGFLVVSGVTFFSTFEVKIDLDNATEKQNSNYQLVQNILDQIVPEPTVTDIADVQAAREGQKFTIEGVVTSNASGYDKDSAYFDCIYVQDATGGINIFPVDGNYQIGQTLQLTGYTSSYNGERQLNVTGYKIIVTDSSIKEVTPREITTKDVADETYLGSLVKVSGTITGYTLDNDGLVESILVKDESGVEARIFIDGYITTGTVIENLAVGNTVTAVGHSSHDTEGPRIRISNRENVVCTPAALDTYTVTYNANGGNGSYVADGLEGDSQYTILGLSATGISHAGYTFKGWNTAADGSGTACVVGGTITITGDVTLYAQWQQEGTGPAATYTVTYNANGGNGSYVAAGLEGDSQYTILGLSATGISHAGYTFKGWNTAADGSGTACAPDGTITITGDVTLYAQWTKTIPGSTTDSGNNASTGSTKTGDTSNMVLWITLACISLAIVVALLWVTHRKKQHGQKR